MKYFLNERHDDVVLVLDEQGQVVGNFVSVEDAIEAYDWMDDSYADDHLMAADASTVGI